MENDLSTPLRTRKRKSRGHGLRTRSGCFTCRKRHLKCNETKPTCGQCLKSGHTCAYPDNLANESSERLSQSEQAPSRSDQASRDAVGNSVDLDQPQPEYTATVDNVAWNTETIQPQPAQTNTSNYDLTPKESSITSPENVYMQALLSGSLSYHSGLSPSTDEYFSRSSSSSGPIVDYAISKWFGLLAGDASLEVGILNPVGQSSADDCHATSRGDGQQSMDFAASPYLSNTHTWQPSVTSANQEAANGPREDGFESSAWRSNDVLTLEDHEHAVFRHFVQHLSHWIDLFDPMQHFSTLVPHLAMRNKGLLKAVLALSIRHLSLIPDGSSTATLDRNVAIQYYNETLQYVQIAMTYDDYRTSLELLATCLIISAYEMLDGSRRDWERHLKGVFWIQRSQVIHGDSNGLKQAVWWAWLCQDVWAAFREKRKAFTFWKPARAFPELRPNELAARSVYVMAQVVNYCSQEELDAADRDLAKRIEQAHSLSKLLDEWQSLLTIEFTPLPLANSRSQDVFQPIWIHPAPFGVAMQVHYGARILLALHRPSRGGFNGFIEQQATLTRYVDKICGIAASLQDNASGVMSSQCLFIAGMSTTDTSRRQAILTLLDSCRQRTGWPVKSLGEELKSLWNDESETR